MGTQVVWHTKGESTHYVLLQEGSNSVGENPQSGEEKERKKERDGCCRRRGREVRAGAAKRQGREMAATFGVERKEEKKRIGAKSALNTHTPSDKYIVQYIQCCQKY